MGTVVYIDDEPALCRIFARILKRTGADVKTFDRAMEAVEFLASGADVSVLLCDYRMPELSGLQVLEKLERDIPFYLVTGDLSVGQDVADKPGVSGVLNKPFKPTQLLELLKPYLPS